MGGCKMMDDNIPNGGRTAKNLKEGQQAMGINWMSWSFLKESIPPAYSYYIAPQGFNPKYSLKDIKKEPYEHLGLCLQYLEQFKREILEESKNKLTKISDFIDALEDQSNNWDKLCDCPASENPMNHEKDCMTIKIRKDISELNL